MFRLSDINIGMKLSLLSGLGIFFVIVLVIVQLVGTAQVKDFDTVVDGENKIGLKLLTVKSDFRGATAAINDVAGSRSPEDLKKSSDRFKRMLGQANSGLQLVTKDLSTAERRAAVEQMLKVLNSYDGIASDLIKIQSAHVAAAGKESQEQAARYGKNVDEFNDKTTEVEQEFEKLIKDGVTVATSTSEKTQDQADDLSDKVKTICIGLGILTVLLMTASAILSVFTIARPLKALIEPLESVADGDFGVAVPGADRKDEVGQIAGAVLRMTQKVSHSVSNIMNSGREVTNASSEIATATTDLSQRTEEQAASLEQTTAAMEELSSTVRKNAENAQLADRDAATTRDVADRGGQVVGRAVEAMAKIEDSSRKISDIIGVIDEIARQTNLLALNAAVEAARAGEAGRGFAVVASEVRSLAQRSSQAAKDITDLITNSNSQVKDGVDLVNKAGESLSEIVESIKKVAVVVSDIANASNEQATGIEQIKRALGQMDEATQQNSALVEENAATAKTLENQAKMLDEQVAYFKIASGSDVAYRPATVMEKPAAKARSTAVKPAPAPKKPVTVAEDTDAVPRAAAAGPARRMQTALATAVNAENDWKEF